MPTFTTYTDFCIHFWCKWYTPYTPASVFSWLENQVSNYIRIYLNFNGVNYNAIAQWYCGYSETATSASSSPQLPSVIDTWQSVGARFRGGQLTNSTSELFWNGVRSPSDYTEPQNWPGESPEVGYPWIGLGDGDFGSWSANCDMAEVVWGINENWSDDVFTQLSKGFSPLCIRKNWQFYCPLGGPFTKDLHALMYGGGANFPFQMGTWTSDNYIETGTTPPWVDHPKIIYPHNVR